MKREKQITKPAFFIQVLLLASLILVLAACGGKGNEETAATPPAGTSEGASAGEEAETSSRAENETSAPAGTSDDAAAGGQPGGTELRAVRDAVAAAYGESYLPQMELDAEMLEAVYGLTPDLYDEAFGEVPMISAQVDTLILVKAKEGKAADVQAALENYRDNQLEQGMNYPMNVPKIEASEVLVYGDYVCYLMLGTIDDSIEDEAEMLAAFREQNEIGKAVLQEQFAE